MKSSALKFYSFLLFAVALKSVKEAVKVKCIQATCVYTGPEISGDDLKVRKDLEASLTTCTPAADPHCEVDSTEGTCFERVFVEDATTPNKKVTRQFGCLPNIKMSVCDSMAGMGPDLGGQCCADVASKVACNCHQEQIPLKCEEFAPEAKDRPSDEGYPIDETRKLTSNKNFWSFTVEDKDTEHAEVFVYIDNEHNKRFALRKSSKTWTIFGKSGFAYPFSNVYPYSKNYTVPIRVVSGLTPETKKEAKYDMIVTVTDNKSPVSKFLSPVPIINLAYQSDETKAGALLYNMKEKIEDEDSTTLKYTLLSECDGLDSNDFQLGSDGLLKVKTDLGSEYLGMDGTIRWILCTTVSDKINDDLEIKFSVKLNGVPASLTKLKVTVFMTTSKAGSGKNLVARLEFPETLPNEEIIWEWETVPACLSIANKEAEQFPTLTRFQDITFDGTNAKVGETYCCSIRGTSNGFGSVVRNAQLCVAVDEGGEPPVFTYDVRTKTLSEDTVTAVKLWTVKVTDPDTDLAVDAMKAAQSTGSQSHLLLEQLNGIGRNFVAVIAASPTKSSISIDIKTAASYKFDYMIDPLYTLVLRAWDDRKMTTSTTFTVSIERSTTRRSCTICDDCQVGQAGTKKRCDVSEKFCCHVIKVAPTRKQSRTSGCSATELTGTGVSCCEEDYCSAMAAQLIPHLIILLQVLLALFL